MHIAYFSPLPPSPSGIADYSAELLPHLGQHAEITLFVDSDEPLDNDLAEAFPVRNVADFGGCRDEFDVALYHMGNDAAYHAAIWHTLQQYPGIVVAHEPLFYHFFQQLTVAHGDVRGFASIVEDVYGKPAAQRAINHLDDGTRNPIAFPLVEPVLGDALGAVVHNHHAARQIRERCLGVPVEVVPHHLSLPAPFDDAVDRAAIRCELELTDRFVVSTFGFLTEWKRIPVALSAFARLHEDHPEAIYCLVGDVRLYEELDVLIGEASVPRESVRVTGRVPLDEFLSYMAATDVAINLRYPTAGETSGTLIRLLGLGVPTIVSDVGSYAEFPANVCAQVPVDGFEEDTLAAILRALTEDEALREALGTNARDYVRTHHTLENSAQAYAAFIERVVAGEAQLATPATTSPLTDVLSDVGGTLAGWGVMEDDDVLLQPIAQAIAELGLSAEERS